MNREELIQKVMNKKVKDYTFVVFFFLIFSVFVFFAIRPNILTAINLQNELNELRFQDEQYERTILNIVDYQTILETTRDEFYLLEDAVPASPRLYGMVENVQKAASVSGAVINDIQVSEVQFKAEEVEKKSNGKRKNDTSELSANSYIVNFNLEGNLQQTQSFIRTILDQRRLKTFETITLSTSQSNASQEAEFNVAIQLEGYYL